MIQNIMYNKTDLIDVANENRVAAVQRAAYQNTLCSPGIGAEPQQARKMHPFRISGSGVFCKLYIHLPCLPVCFSLASVILEHQPARKKDRTFRAILFLKRA